MSLLGIDVGTGGCKAAAYRPDGALLSAAYREYAADHPRPGWAELNAAAVLEIVYDAVAEVASTAPEPVTALSISSFGEALTPVDADGNVIAPCILSADSRGGQYVRALAEHPGQEAFYRINPNILGVGYSLPKLLWMKDHQPGRVDRADAFLLFGDLLAAAMTGRRATTPSMANRTMLLDIRTEDWSKTLLDRFDLRAETLPEVVPSGTILGQVLPGVARRLGLPDGVAVVAGGHDQALNALGAGICEPGQAVCGIGSFECITPVFDHVPDAPAMIRQGLNVEHHVLPGRYLSFLFNHAGSLVRWFRDAFAADADPDAGLYDRLAAEMPDEPTGLFVLPYFEATGSPKFLADCTGVIAGLRTSTTRGEILRAIMESTALYFLDSLRGLGELGIDTAEMIATGGGSRSDAWLQIKADVLGVPFHRPANPECGTAGAAILAGLATGEIPSAAEAARRFVRIEATFRPDPARHGRYLERHAVYRRLAEAVEPLMPEI